MESKSNMSRTRTMVDRKRRRLRKSVKQLVLVSLLMLFIIGIFIFKNIEPEKVTTEPVKNERNHKNEWKEEIPIVEETSLKLSAAGDFTLGTDETFSYLDSFVNEASVMDILTLLKVLAISF